MVCCVPSLSFLTPSNARPPPPPSTPLLHPPTPAELQARLFQLRAVAVDAIAANASARRRVELLRALWLACAALQHLSGVQPAENWAHLVLGLEEGAVRLARLVHCPRPWPAASGGDDAAAAAAAAAAEGGAAAGGGAPAMPQLQLVPLIER
jgi:hypothetical protein